MLVQTEVRRVFDYNEETGELFWKIKPSHCVKIGDKAGCLTLKGYLTVRFKGKRYYIHRLVWLWVKGYFPENGLDHIDRNKQNNKIGNLREESVQCNNRNRGIFYNNTSGVKGVYWNKAQEKWRAYIKINSEDKHLGYYADKVNATAARLAAEQCVDWEGCDTSSPSYLAMVKYIKEKRNGRQGVGTSNI